MRLLGVRNFEILLQEEEVYNSASNEKVVPAEIRSNSVNVALFCQSQILMTVHVNISEI